MKLSLAGWSLNRLFRAKENPLKLVDFPAFSREQFGIDAVELNSPFFASRDAAYLAELRRAADKARSTMLNIAVDEKGDLAGDDASRKEGLECYGRWIPVARELGISAIRCNSGGKTITDRPKSIQNCIDSFRRLADQGTKLGVKILMENHGGLSSDADSIIAVMDAVRQTHGSDSVGTLPDFGNWPADADIYGQLERIMPYAGAVHAKVMDIDENLDHPRFDLDRCLQIARQAGYDGYLGIEFEGKGDEMEGVRRSIRKLKEALSPES